MVWFLNCFGLKMGMNFTETRVQILETRIEKGTGKFLGSGFGEPSRKPPPKIPRTSYTLAGEGAGKGLRVLQIPPNDKSYSVLQCRDLFKLYDDIENTVTTFSYFTENQELFDCESSRERITF